MKKKRDWVNWDKTISKYGKSRRKPTPKDKVIIDCSFCESDFEINYGNIKTRNGKPYEGICLSCKQKRTWKENQEFRETVSKKNSEKQKEVWNREYYKENQSEKQKELTTKRWQNPEYRERVTKGVKNAHATIDGYTQSCIRKHTPESREKQRQITLKLWQDPEYRRKTVEAIRKNWIKPEFIKTMDDVRKSDEYIQKQIKSHSNPEYIKQLSDEKKQWWIDNEEELLKIYRSDNHRQNLRKVWNRPGYREMMSEMARNLWKNPIYAEKCLKNHSSKLEEHLAEILDSSSVEYERQFNLGHWSFDFMLDTKPVKTLIEVQGEYWHFKKFGNQESPRDKAKATFVEKYYSNDYKLVTIWENEFLSPERLSNRIDEIFGYSINLIDFVLKDCVVREIDGPTASKFFSKYHYSASGGRGGLNIGCFLNDNLIAVCRYCSPTRKQSADRLGLEQKELKELTKFAIHPSYQKKNLATWFLARTQKFLPANIKCLLSFADETFGHTGTIYKAANWKHDGVIEPDYVYVDSDGFVMHKRTLWNHAKKMGMKEIEYADLWGYTKMWGKPKHRFILKRAE